MKTKTKPARTIELPKEPVRPTRKRIERALAKLGTTADEIAASLKALRIKGKKSDPRTCALAAFLKKWFGIGKGCNKHCAVEVGLSNAKIGEKYKDGWTAPGPERIEVVISPGHRDFIHAFDGNAYPQLQK